jgi:hypothetical protein
MDSRAWHGRLLGLLDVSVVLAAVVVLLVRALGAAFKATTIAATVGPAETSLGRKLFARGGAAHVGTSVSPAVSEPLGNVLTVSDQTRRTASMLEAEVAELGAVCTSRKLAPRAAAVAHAQLARERTRLAIRHRAVDNLAALARHGHDRVGRRFGREQVADRERAERREPLGGRAVFWITHCDRKLAWPLLSERRRWTRRRTSRAVAVAVGRWGWRGRRRRRGRGLSVGGSLSRRAVENEGERGLAAAHCDRGGERVESSGASRSDSEMCDGSLDESLRSGCGARKEGSPRGREWTGDGNRRGLPECG